MTDPALIGSAALLALAGAGHCLGMCAGISGALTFSLPPERQTGAELWAWQGLFSIGRVLSYGLLGALAGGLGGGVMSALPVPRGAPFFASGVLMLLLALTFAGRAAGLAWLERAGQSLWRRLQPLVKQLLPVDGPFKALALGMAWGLLPCGLVYSALALAVTAASAPDGMLVMLVFGLDTMPTGMGAGVVTGRLGWLRTRGWRLTATLLALLMAGWFLWQGLQAGAGHGAHAHDGDMMPGDGASMHRH
jgi:sulfite exporter TauE/SafE